MSVCVEHIARVVHELKSEILNRLDNSEEVKEEYVEAITRDVFKKCATIFNVEESTIRDQCTRQIDIDTATFYNLVKEYLLRENTTLEDRVVIHMRGDDTEKSVRAALRAVK